MLDKDKLWVQFNVYVGHLSDEDVEEYINRYVKSVMSALDESIKPFFNPTKDKNLPLIVVLHPKFYKKGEEVNEITYENFTNEQNAKFRKILHNGVFLGEIEILEDEQ